VAQVDPSRPFVLTEPFAVTLDLAALAVATRPPEYNGSVVPAHP